MLLSFSCKNFRSIREEITFSMMAMESFEEMSDNLISVKCSNTESKVVRFAEIYGANATGKTNILRAIGFMSTCVGASYSNEPGDSFFYEPHKLSDGEPSSFSVWFVKDEIKFFYGFSCDRKGIIEECLYCFFDGKKLKIFERNEVEVTFGESFVSGSDNVENHFKKNRLILSIAANVTNNVLINKAFMFFKEDVIIVDRKYQRFKYAQMLYDNTGRQNKELVNKINDFMKKFSPRLKGIIVKRVNLDLPTEILEQLRQKAEEVNRRKVDLSELGQVITEASYDSFSVDMSDESDGMKELFEIYPMLVAVLSGEKILLWDEMEKRLHPIIVKELIKWFCGNRTSDAQIIVTTHNTDLLDLGIVRRDQIWFTEMDEKTNESTVLYSLSDIKNVQRDEDIRNGYLSGRYGAIPILNKTFLDSCGKEGCNG